MHFSGMTAEERVFEGVKWLDENAPGNWWALIDYDILDVRDGSVCVLGQVFADAAREVGLVSGYAYAAMPDYYPGHPNPVRSVQKHGFCGVGGPDDEQNLRDEWINVCESRRALVNA